MNLVPVEPKVVNVFAYVAGAVYLAAGVTVPLTVDWGDTSWGDTSPNRCQCPSLETWLNMCILR